MKPHLLRSPALFVILAGSAAKQAPDRITLSLGGATMKSGGSVKIAPNGSAV